MKIEPKGTLDSPKFMIEDKVIIYNFRTEESRTGGEKEFVYSMDYDEDVVTESEAGALGAKAIELIIKGFGDEEELELSNIEGS